MRDLNSNPLFTQWVTGNCACIATAYMTSMSTKPKTLHKFVKNLDAPSCVLVLAKGMAIHYERRLAGHTEMFHKSTSN